MKYLILLSVLIFLGGCAFLEQKQTASSADGDSEMRGTAGALPKKFQLHDVPHNPRKQDGTDCAPDSLRMVLTYRGRNVGADWDIPQKLTSDLTGLRGKSGGTSFSQMQKITAEYYDLPAFVIRNCDLDSLKSAIVNGLPPVISYRYRGRSYHAVVAVGFDDKRHRMIIHDPNFQRVKKIRYDDLGGTSEDSVQRISCLLVLPNGKTEEDLRRGLEKYVPKEIVSKLRISSMIPSQDKQER